MDYLQQANRDLEKRLAQCEESLTDSDQTIKSLEARNDELCLEIAKMEKLYQNLNQEKRNGDEEIDLQICELQKEAEDNHQNIVDLQSNNYNLKKVCHLLALGLLGLASSPYETSTVSPSVSQ